VDANFRLQEKHKPNRYDPGLVRGGAFFGPDELHAREKSRVEKLPLPSKRTREGSTCDSSFAAVERAESRRNQGLTVTGVVAVVDARHGFVFPNGVYDLDKGEK
jgi:hypothetical protein